MSQTRRFAIVLALVLLAAGTATAWAQAPLKVGEVRAYRAETPHPYPLGNQARPVVWTDTVISPGAEFIRVHFTGLHLAPGDSLTVSSPDRSQLWEYTDRGPHANGDVWSFAVDGDTAVVRIHGGRNSGFGYRIDAVGHGTVRPEPSPEVVCGTDGREDVACHIHDKGFDEAQRPVARLLFASGGFLFLCTGWLADGADDSTLVTNNHCISRQREVESLEARFNFQHTRCAGSVVAPTSSYSGGTLLKTNNITTKGAREGLDYTLLTLLGAPEATWGELIPTIKSIAVGDPIWFIQHGGGRPKQVGFWEDADQTVLCRIDSTDQTFKQIARASQTEYACDSEGGSSGSPIVDPVTGHVIALHHFGGTSSNPCLNSGTEMPEICADAGALLNCAAD